METLSQILMNFSNGKTTSKYSIYKENGMGCEIPHVGNHDKIQGLVPRGQKMAHSIVLIFLLLLNNDFERFLFSKVFSMTPPSPNFWWILIAATHSGRGIRSDPNLKSSDFIPNWSL